MPPSANASCLLASSHPVPQRCDSSRTFLSSPPSPAADTRLRALVRGAFEFAADPWGLRAQLSAFFSPALGTVRGWLAAVAPASFGGAPAASRHAAGAPGAAFGGRAPPPMGFAALSPYAQAPAHAHAAGAAASSPLSHPHGTLVTLAYKPAAAAAAPTRVSGGAGGTAPPPAAVEIRCRVNRVALRFPLALAAGALLFANAHAIGASPAFYYGGGFTAGALVAVGFLALLLARNYRSKSLWGAGLASVTYAFLRSTFRSLVPGLDAVPGFDWVGEHWPALLALFVVGSGCVVCLCLYVYGRVQNPRALNVMGWLVKGAALLLIYAGTQSSELSLALAAAAAMSGPVASLARGVMWVGASIGAYLPFCGDCSRRYLQRRRDAAAVKAARAAADAGVVGGKGGVDPALLQQQQQQLLLLQSLQQQQQQQALAASGAAFLSPGVGRTLQTHQQLLAAQQAAAAQYAYQQGGYAPVFQAADGSLFSPSGMPQLGYGQQQQQLFSPGQPGSGVSRAAQGGAGAAAAPTHLQGGGGGGGGFWGFGSPAGLVGRDAHGRPAGGEGSGGLLSPQQLQQLQHLQRLQQAGIAAAAGGAHYPPNDGHYAPSGVPAAPFGGAPLGYPGGGVSVRPSAPPAEEGYGLEGSSGGYGAWEAGGSYAQPQRAGYTGPSKLPLQHQQQHPRFSAGHHQKHPHPAAAMDEAEEGEFDEEEADEAAEEEEEEEVTPPFDRSRRGGGGGGRSSAEGAPPASQQRLARHHYDDGEVDFGGAGGRGGGGAAGSSSRSAPRAGARAAASAAPSAADARRGPASPRGTPPRREALLSPAAAAGAGGSRARGAGGSSAAPSAVGSGAKRSRREAEAEAEARAHASPPASPALRAGTGSSSSSSSSGAPASASKAVQGSAARPGRGRPATAAAATSPAAVSSGVASAASRRSHGHMDIEGEGDDGHSHPDTSRDTRSRSSSVGSASMRSGGGSVLAPAPPQRELRRRGPAAAAAAAALSPAPAAPKQVKRARLQ